MKEWYSYSGILLLAEVLKGLALKPLDNATIHSLIGFFADRLVSWFSVAQISHLSPCFSWVCFGFNSVLLLFVVELLSLSSLPCLIYGENISLIRSKIKSRQYQEKFLFLSGNDKTKFEEQQILLDYLIHMADLGHNCKKFDISVIWIQLLCEEFWAQGDQERERGLPISFMCDRNNIDVPASQIGFLRGFIFFRFEI